MFSTHQATKTYIFFAGILIPAKSGPTNQIREGGREEKREKKREGKGGRGLVSKKEGSHPISMKIIR